MRNWVSLATIVSYLHVRVIWSSIQEGTRLDGME